MAFMDIPIAVIVWFWGMFKLWLWLLFGSPIANPQTLWVLIPIWGGWVFSEFFQEKEGTSMGNAISNGFFGLWAGVDWLRNTVGTIGRWGDVLTGKVALKLFLSAMVLGYGFTILYLGVRGRTIIKQIGRLRIVTYVVASFTPLVYGTELFTIEYLLAIVMFFPMFYYLVEWLDKVIPTPKFFYV